MEIEALEIDGAWLLSSPVHEDERGSFQEWFKYTDIEVKTGHKFEPQQANVSVSQKSVLRGIHFSLAPKGQVKLVTCLTGKILDVIVDVRPNSSTFKKWIAVELSAGSGKGLLIGKGLGHAFLSLENQTTVAYLLNSPFSPSEEFEINPFDPELNIDWNFHKSDLVLSKKDLEAPRLLFRLRANQLPII